MGTLKQLTTEELRKMMIDISEDEDNQENKTTQAHIISILLGRMLGNE